MTKKTVKMNLTERAYNVFKRIMKINGFKNNKDHEDLFLRYAVMKLAKNQVNKDDKTKLLKEMKQIKEYISKK